MCVIFREQLRSCDKIVLDFLLKDEASSGRFLEILKVCKMIC